MTSIDHKEVEPPKSIKITIPGFGDCEGSTPIVILGPNGSGKTQLAQKMSGKGTLTAVSAQRRTWIDDTISVQEERQLRAHVDSQQNNWRSQSWQQTDEINQILSDLIQKHTDRLTRNNQEAIQTENPIKPVKDTGLIQLQGIWKRVYPTRELEIGGFFPRVRRTDGPSPQTYTLKQMSDGERSVLYMAARILTANTPAILVDEPELHMHSRLAVAFWDEAEKLRSDCRFIYVTHDLNFALSRRNATVLAIKAVDQPTIVAMDKLDPSVAREVLGGATLPFYAQRIFFYEGEVGKVFASELFSAWFDDDKTFAIPAGGRDAVFASVSGLKSVGVVAATVAGIVDRDYYSDDVLNAVTSGVTVLPVHEIESVLCDRQVVVAIAKHLGKVGDEVWYDFITRVRKEFSGERLNHLVAQRVRSRIGDLMNGAFSSGQISSDLTLTTDSHVASLNKLDLASKTSAMFTEETARVTAALKDGDDKMLAILPGKQLLSLLVPYLGIKGLSELTNLVVKALRRDRPEALKVFGSELEAALQKHLPARKGSDD